MVKTAARMSLAGILRDEHSCRVFLCAAICFAVCDFIRAGAGAMNHIDDHPQRYALANELHARPFPALEANSRAVHLAILREGDKGADLAHLNALLDRFGAQHPGAGATHYFADLGPFRLKWEQHTEFVTYTLFVPGLNGRAFDPVDQENFPADWLASVPGSCITAALVRVEAQGEDDQSIRQKLRDWFVPESLAVAEVAEQSAVIAGDFRIDPAGMMRFAVFVQQGTGPRRIGRVVQRLCEIETYKAMSMLGFATAKEMARDLDAIDARLGDLTEQMRGQGRGADKTLDALLEIAAELESLEARSSFRFSGTRAYAALVGQRIAVLQETRFQGRQLFSDFMARRFDPAMRTVQSTKARLDNMAGRAMRAGELLRTRVDVERSAQNRDVLASMDRRAALQLRLQKTVEGLSVVAVSYYAVNLASYFLYPGASWLGLGKPWLTAGLTPLVVGVVYLALRRIRHNAE